MSKANDNVRTIMLDIARRKRQQSETRPGGYLWRTLQAEIDDMEDALKSNLEKAKKEGK